MRQRLHEIMLAALFFSVFLLNPVKAEADPKEIKRWLKSFQWQKIKGDAVDLDVSHKGVVYALSSKQRVYRWRQDRGWRLLPGKFSQLTVDGKSKPWAIDQSGQVRRFNGLWWGEKGKLAQPAVHISASQNNAIFILDKQSNLYRWVEDSKSWKAAAYFDQGYGDVIQLAVDLQGVPWVVTSTNDVYSLSDKSWQKKLGETAAIAFGNDGVVAKVNPQKNLSMKINNKWHTLPNTKKASRIALGISNTPWYSSDGGDVYVAGFATVQKDLEKVEPVAVVKPDQKKKEAVIRAKNFSAIKKIGGKRKSEEFFFTQIKGSFAQDISIGSDGSVFIIGDEGQLLRWNNGRSKFFEYPGILKKVAVSSYGLPWGINNQKQIYRIKNNLWVKVGNLQAVDITIAEMGEVYVTTVTDAVYRFNDRFNRFDKVLGVSGTKVAVDDNAQLWTLNNAGKIFQCPKLRCKIVPGLKAKDLVIGPLGTVFAISLDNRLYQYLPNKSAWNRLRDNVLTVSIGPKDYPWITTTDETVWYSALFPRDEESDSKIALTIKGSTLDIKVQPVISIRKNIRFAKVGNPKSINLSSFALNNGADGELFLYGESSSNVASSGKKTWVNQQCLDNPAMNLCFSPGDCGTSTDDACIDCNQLANQNTTKCKSTDVALDNGSPIPDGQWVNGFCLMNPNNMECSGQIQGQLPNAAGVDCNIPPNQTGSVCIQFNNNKIASMSTEYIAMLYNKSQKRFNKLKNIPQQKLFDITIDSSDRLWIASDNDVYRESRKGSSYYQKVYSFRDAGSIEPSFAINTDNIYYLSKSGKLYLYNEKYRRFSAVFHGMVATRVAINSRSKLWVEKNNNIYTIIDDVVKAATKPYPQQADIIRLSPLGRVYLLQDKSLKVYNSVNKNFETIRFQINNPKSIAVDSDQKLWVLTNDSELFRQK